jgi:hypothetical protein
MTNPRPPKAWFDDKKERVKKQYKGKKVNIDRIVASIWWKMSEFDRAAIIRRISMKNPTSVDLNCPEVSRFLKMLDNDEYYDSKYMSSDIMSDIWNNFQKKHIRDCSRCKKASTRIGMPNPAKRLNRKQKKSISLLTIAAIAGIAYVIWKNRK